jgi:uncharacterized protein
MLSFDLRSLESQAARVDGTLAADDAVWVEGDVRPVGSIHVTGRLSSAGSERFYFSGHLEGVARDTCRRCLVDVETPVREDVHLLFAEAGGEDDDDPDVYPIAARDHDLDLRPAIREEWLLAVPPLVVCKEECKGLCPHCGADLNAGACSCAPVRDARWDALRSLDESAR